MILILFIFQVVEYLTGSGEVEQFEPTAVLVATWIGMEPYNWWSYYCRNYTYYQHEQWFQDYYAPYCSGAQVGIFSQS